MQSVVFTWSHKLLLTGLTGGNWYHVTQNNKSWPQFPTYTSDRLRQTHESVLYPGYFYITWKAWKLIYHFGPWKFTWILSLPVVGFERVGFIYSYSLNYERLFLICVILKFVLTPYGTHAHATYRSEWHMVFSDIQSRKSCINYASMASLRSRFINIYKINNIGLYFK